MHAGVALATETAGSSCPVCSSPLTQDVSFVQWCQHCEWNLDPTPKRPSPKRRRLRADRRGDRLARQLFEAVRAEAPGKRGGALLTAAIWVLASFVHLCTVSVIAGGLFLLALAQGIPLWARLTGEIVLLALAYCIQPFRVRRRGWIELRRLHAPHFFALIDEVARSIGAPTVDRAAIDASFNAFYTTGARRRRVVGVGMSLWHVLDPQARVALLGHAVNGDLRNTKLVGFALSSLARWRELLRSDPSTRHRLLVVSAEQGLASLSERVLVPMLLLPITAIIGGFGRVLQTLAYRQGQRSEYYADELASRVAGTAAAVGLLEAGLVQDFCLRELLRAVPQDPEPWARLRHRLGELPATEWERRRRVARRKLSRIDETHPPTQLRVDLLLSRPSQAPRVKLDALRSARIEAELEPVRRLLARWLSDRLGA